MDTFFQAFQEIIFYIKQFHSIPIYIWKAIQSFCANIKFDKDQKVVIIDLIQLWEASIKF